MRRRAFLAGATVSLVPIARASEPIRNAIALAGDRFSMGDEEYHLTDILAPSAFDLHRDTAPFFTEAKDVLQSLLSNNDVSIYDTGERNRWRVRIVSARIGVDGVTLQERLVAAGAARVNPKTDNHELIETLLSLEGTARANRTGLWALRAYCVFDAGDASGAIGGFNLVEGRVTTARAGRGRFYLNFGADYRTDFTATAPSRRARRWARDGVDLETFQDARLRVRGFVESINGPSIELGHVKAIEVLA